MMTGSSRLQSLPVRWPRLLAAVLLLLAGGASHAMAETVADDSGAPQTFALLVGVSTYANLPAILHLDGPRNDVQMWQSLLLGRNVSPDNMVVLADGVEGAALPTRAAIFDAFAELTKAVEAGDNVFILMAGHGSQQPQGALGDKSEADGLDEIFLPFDAGRWSGSAGEVENAIVDDEFGEVIDRLRAKGALVWVVFDACHSGTMDRGGMADGDMTERDRGIEPAALGVPLRDLERGDGDPHEGSMDESGLEAPAGGLVAFYAAQSWERAPEKLFKNERGERAFFGLFSRTLAEIVSDSQPPTFAALIEEVRASYAEQGRDGPNPLAEGSALNEPIFLHDPSAPPRRENS